MSDELTVTASASWESGNWKDQFKPGTLKFDVSGVGQDGGIVEVGTSEEDLSLPNVSTLGWVFMRNLDATNYVTYGPKDTTMKAFGRIKAGEVAMFRLEPGITLRWQANTAAVRIAIKVIED